MNKIENPDANQLKQIIQRPLLQANGLQKSVQKIIDQVAQGGDKAVLELTARFDKAQLNELRVSVNEIENSKTQTSDQLKKAIALAAKNIENFHKIQKSSDLQLETMPGVVCRQKNVPIENVGLYIPGGTAPLISTVLMLAIPAKIAGCSNLVLCSPPDSSGKINPAILYAAQFTGVNTIFKVGGAQAIAAMALGTESIPKVDKIVGPGNQYVTMAKQLLSLSGKIAMDMPAGPSEVLVMADQTANPAFVAADLLSQAEHGVDSQVILLTTDRCLFQNIDAEIQKQLKDLTRKEIAAKSLENSSIVLLENEEQMLKISELYAPEHLIIATENATKLAEKVTQAGSVFIGNYTPESAGDYASGTNHTLPTNGFARMYSGLNTNDFMKKITFQEISPSGLLNLAESIESLATAEQLQAHKNAVSIRVKYLIDNKL